MRRGRRQPVRSHFHIGLGRVRVRDLRGTSVKKIEAIFLRGAIVRQFLPSHDSVTKSLPLLLQRCGLNIYL